MSQPGEQVLQSGISYAKNMQIKGFFNCYKFQTIRCIVKKTIQQIMKLML